MKHAASTRIPWNDARLTGLYQHHANGGVYLCAEGDGVALGVVWGDGSGAWYERCEGPSQVVKVAEMDGPPGWPTGKRVDVGCDEGGWYWLVQP